MINRAFLVVVAAVLALAGGTTLYGVLSELPSGVDDARATDRLGTRLEEVHQLLAASPIGCKDGWEVAGPGQGYDDTPGVCQFGDEIILVGVLPSAGRAAMAAAEDQKFARCQDVFAEMNPELGLSGSDPAINSYLAGIVLLQSVPLSVEGILDDVLSGQMYRASDPYPAGVDPTELEESAAPEGDGTPTENGCVENCSWTRTDVVRDLDLILCRADVDFPMELREDVTSIYGVADQVLLCTAGGSMDTQAWGIAYLWDEYTDITDEVLEPFALCDSQGAAAYGGEPGNPGYLVANIQTGQKVLDQLVRGGASVICPTP